MHPFPAALRLLFLSLFPLLLAAQPVDRSLLLERWPAHWIEAADTDPNAYGVYLFRKPIELTERPEQFIVNVSADNRYKLYVNGELVSLGPARGDLVHWYFETVDIAPYLQAGTNVIAARVWNEGPYRPEAQITHRTAFLLQGNTEAEQIVNTDASWQARTDASYAPLVYRPQYTYYVSGAGEIREMARAVPGWREPDVDDEAWAPAREIMRAVPKSMLGSYGTITGWMLLPSDLPPMEMTTERLRAVDQVTGAIELPDGFPAEPIPLTIPAQTTVTLILDQGHLTNAYPTLIFSGGEKAEISLRYAESLYTDYPVKGNRDVVAGKSFYGRQDSLVSSGATRQEFTALSYRTYRYVELRVSTQAEPLVIEDLYGTFTGYPFALAANLRTQESELQQMLDIGWRTARLCAVDTYMDCPYYEQLQYIGDARIQALVSLYNSGDERLVRRALDLMDFSRQPEGVTLSRHPSYTPQYIPTFSFWYIGMLHDYSRYGSDPDFVRRKLAGMRQVLDYFQSYQDTDGSLRNVPHWLFTDWVDNREGWRSGVGPMSADGTSALLDLQLLLAYQTAADLERTLGMPAFAERYETAARQLQATVWAKYWDRERGLFADRPEQDLFSQHTNTLAILTGTADPATARQLAGRLLDNDQLAPASIYFKYYLHRALIRAGQGNAYLSWLDTWRENIALGLTTWAEQPNVSRSRSDCHAWGSSPNIEFYRTILGIDSDGVGFSRVRIEPHLNGLTDIGGEMPHPLGEIRVDYRLEGSTWRVSVELPERVAGELVWAGRSLSLTGGVNRFGFTE